MSADILARIEAAYDQIEMVQVDVPEWDVTLYFPRSISLARRRMISTGVPSDDEGALMVNYIIHEARDENGKQVFTADAKTRATLEGKASATVIQDILTKIGMPETVDEAKND